ncbi:hypothetical protein WJX84_004496 [Apatococcus fuscideae]|uniref:BLOC-1-related complex subunit 7 n=1 Tax=Apatococcus fuscideae TaxID=2026836 RepID=A0AAW1T4I4_9CHLO
MFQQVAERPLGGLSSVTEHVKNSRSPLQEAQQELVNCRANIKEKTIDIGDAKLTVQALKTSQMSFLQDSTKALENSLQIVRQLQRRS